MRHIIAHQTINLLALVHPDTQALLPLLEQGDRRALARAITVVENGLTGAQDLLERLQHTAEARVVGITGPPGAGKSSLVAALLRHWTGSGQKVAVLAVDPTSPFNFGAILGDRIRMAEFFSDPLVYIRSLASRGALGGLHPRMLEVTDLVKDAGFDRILVETVGVGQSEVEVAGLADCTVVVVVPEAGDEVQAMKSGVLEIADVFVVNKGDRPEADAMVKRLRMLAHERPATVAETRVVKTVATKGEGVAELVDAIDLALSGGAANLERRTHLLVDKAFQIIAAERTRDVSRVSLFRALQHAIHASDFNIYRFAKQFSGA